MIPQFRLNDLLDAAGIEHEHTLAKDAGLLDGLKLRGLPDAYAVQDAPARRRRRAQAMIEQEHRREHRRKRAPELVNEMQRIRRMMSLMDEDEQAVVAIMLGEMQEELRCL